MKVDKYYDVGCDVCGRHLSTDWKYGMFASAKEARQFAKGEGFTEYNGLNVCPSCYRDITHGYVKIVKGEDK